MDASSWTPGAFVRILALGLYVLGGELNWTLRKGISRLTRGTRDDATLRAWRQAQIDRRVRLFSLDG